MNTIESGSITSTSTSRVPTVPWGMSDLLFAILLAAGGIVILNLIVLAAILISKIPLKENGLILILFVIVQDIVILFAALLFSVVRYRVDWSMLGLRSFNVPVGCGLSAALYFVSFITTLVYRLIMMQLGFKLQDQAIVGLLDTSGLGLIVTLLGVGIVGPIIEEIFFRGFLYGGLRKRLGVLGAMIGSTLFFTALHFTIDQFIPIFFLGLFLAWLYERTGSLFPGIFLHITNNSFAVIVLAIARAMGMPLSP